MIELVPDFIKFVLCLVVGIEKNHLLTRVQSLEIFYGQGDLLGFSAPPHRV
jgi:hypothetical protein